MAALTEVIRNAGFENIQFSDYRYDTFSDAPQASSAEEFGTKGINFIAFKTGG